MWYVFHSVPNPDRNTSRFYKTNLNVNPYTCLLICVHVCVVCLCVFVPDNVCRCDNGSPVTKTACTSNGASMCEGCNAGFTINARKTKCTGVWLLALPATLPLTLSPTATQRKTVRMLVCMFSCVWQPTYAHATTVFQRPAPPVPRVAQPCARDATLGSPSTWAKQSANAKPNRRTKPSAAKQTKVRVSLRPSLTPTLILTVYLTAIQGKSVHMLVFPCMCVRVCPSQHMRMRQRCANDRHPLYQAWREHVQGMQRWVHY